MWNNGSDVMQPVVARELHPVREALPRHHVREMRLHHELRAPGRARRRDHHRDVVLVDVRRDRRRRVRPRRARRDRRPARSTGADSIACSTVGASPPSVTINAGSHLLDEARDLRDRALRVDRHLDGPDFHQREPAQQVVGRVAGRDHHAVPHTHTAGTQRARHPFHALVRLGEREHARPRVQPRFVGNVGDRGAHERGNGAFHVPVSSSPSSTTLRSAALR